MDEAQAASAGKPVRLAVFDFDGTSIDGNSPVLLVEHLVRHKLIRKRVASRIALWGLAYKLRLPQNESWVRGLVFTAFEGKPVAQVDEYLARFYDTHIAKLFRPEADAAMRKHAAAGHVVVVVSATFEPIILRAMSHHPFEHEAATRMKAAPNGTYTCEVEGLPVEGAEKLVAVTRLADGLYGAGNWLIDSAYGDHHSDREIIGAAEHSYCVNPDRPLARLARQKGWDILTW